MVKAPFDPRLLKEAVEALFCKPVTQMYPTEKPQLGDNYRGQPITDFSLCIGCGICSRECPARAIQMVQCGAKKSPQLNLAKCIFCYRCAEVCPKKAIKNSKIYELATTDKSTLIVVPPTETELKFKCQQH